VPARNCTTGDITEGVPEHALGRREGVGEPARCLPWSTYRYFFPYSGLQYVQIHST
jgi:hypothetical protein